MAGRPKKEGADWFSHDCQARNNRKIKALENKYGLTGYAVFFKTLELLSASPGTRIEFNELEATLVAGDFGLEPQLLSEIWTYCILLGLLQRNEVFIFSLSLKERLKPMFEKREKDRSRQKRKYRSENTGLRGNYRRENANSRSENATKESIEKESIEKEKNEDTLAAIQEEYLQKIIENNSIRVHQWQQKAQAVGVDVKELQIAFINKAIREEYSPSEVALQAGFDSYLNTTVNRKQNETAKNRTAGPSKLYSAAKKGTDNSTAKSEERYSNGW